MLGLADWYYLARPDSVGKRAALETAIQVVMPRLSAAEMARVRAERVLPDWFWPAVDDEAAGWRSV